MSFRLTTISFLCVFLFPALVGAVTFEGDVAFGGSYNTNISLLSSEELTETGLSRRNNAAFGIDADAILSLQVADIFAFEYALFASVVPEELSYSFLNHSLAALFSHEFDEVDIEYGVEFSHLLVGPYNRLVDPQALFNLFWYAHERCSYYLTFSFSYTAGIAENYGYLTAPGGRLENGVYLYPVAGNRSFISLGLGERIFFFGEEYVTPSETSEPPMWLQHGFSETYLRLKGKIFYKGFSAEASARYGLSYYLAPDRWEVMGMFPEPPTAYEKRRVDHSLRLKATLEYRFTELFSLLGYYQYLRNFSNIGAEATDYSDLSYDQHLTGVMLRFVF